MAACDCVRRRRVRCVAGAPAGALPPRAARARVPARQAGEPQAELQVRACPSPLALPFRPADPPLCLPTGEVPPRCRHAHRPALASQSLCLPGPTAMLPRPPLCSARPCRCRACQRDVRPTHRLTRPARRYTATAVMASLATPQSIKAFTLSFIDTRRSRCISAIKVRARLPPHLSPPPSPPLPASLPTSPRPLIQAAQGVASARAAPMPTCRSAPRRAASCGIATRTWRPASLLVAG